VRAYLEADRPDDAARMTQMATQLAVRIEQQRVTALVTSTSSAALPPAAPLSVPKGIPAAPAPSTGGSTANTGAKGVHPCGTRCEASTKGEQAYERMCYCATRDMHAGAGGNGKAPADPKRPLATPAATSAPALGPADLGTGVLALASTRLLQVRRRAER